MDYLYTAVEQHNVSYYCQHTYVFGDHGGTVVKVLCYKSGRSLVRSQMVSLEFFIDIILPIALWPWGRLGL